MQQGGDWNEPRYLSASVKSNGPVLSTEPVRGTDYPTTRQEFRSIFPDDVAWLAYLVRVRWPTGFRCPRCGGVGWLTARGTYACGNCGRHTSPTAGSVFDGMRKPLLDWFEVMWWLTTDKRGSSTRRVLRDLRLGSQETAWASPHKLRRAVGRHEREMLAAEMLAAKPGTTSRRLGRVHLAVLPLDGGRGQHGRRAAAHPVGGTH